MILSKTITLTEEFLRDSDISLTNIAKLAVKPHGIYSGHIRVIQTKQEKDEGRFTVEILYRESGV